MQLLLPALFYVALLAVVLLLNRHEFARSPEKAERYRLLPIGYKLACWFGVIPLLVAALFVHGAFMLAALLSWALLEHACVRWYVKAGLFRM